MSSDEVHLVWPEQRFYWSVLDAGGVRSAGPLPDALMPEFAEDVPVPIEELFAVAAPTECGGLLVCGARVDELEAAAGDVLSITPRSVPAALGVRAECDGLNLLVGPFEPRPIRRTRRRRNLLRMAVVAVFCGVMAAGMERRTRHWMDASESARAAANSICGELFPDRAVVWSEQMMESELAALRSRVRAAELATPPPDAALHLAGLLSGWPAHVPSKPQSISVSPGSILVSVSIEGDASAFIRAMKPPAGWVLLEPRINSAAGINRVSLQLRPAVSDAKGGA